MSTIPPDPSPERRQPRASANLRGAGWLVVSAVAATGMAVSVRDASETMHPLQIAFVRFLIGLLVVLAFVVPRGLGSVRTRRLPMHVLRGVLGVVAVGFAYQALAVLPLVTATVLFFTAPLFVTFLAIPMLGERVGWRRAVATGFGFIGAVIVVGWSPGGFHPAMLAALVSAFVFSFALIVGKRLATTETPGTILFYFALVTTVGSLAPALAVWRTPAPEGLGAVVLVGLFAVSRAYTDIRGYAVGEASFVAPFTYVRIVLIGAAGYVIFGEVPDAGAFAGTALIVASTLYVAHREARSRKAGGAR